MTNTVDIATSADPVSPNSDGAVGTESEVPPTRGEHRSSGNFPGIGDYAFLSDCEANCLIAPSGAIEWMCSPRPDSPSVFTALLDRAGGSFRVAPFGVAVPAARRYLPGTLVLNPPYGERIAPMGRGSCCVSLHTLAGVCRDTPDRERV